jgi:hypothetical protein
MIKAPTAARILDDGKMIVKQPTGTAALKIHAAKNR